MNWCSHTDWGKTETFTENCSITALSTTNPTRADPVLDAYHSGESPATNNMSRFTFVCPAY